MSLAPAASSEDLIKVVRHKLLSESAITDIVGGRVYGAHFQDPDARTVVYPMVVMEMRGGGSLTATYQATTLYLYAYSRDSQGKAFILYDAVYQALQQQRVARDGVSFAGYCMEANRPDSGWNEAARAYYARGLWTVRGAFRS